jgi:TPP-dependent pyruvate/acetoin dehydrogenase alpha subunit
LVTSDELKQIDAEVKKEVDEGVKAAKSDPEIDLEELYADVYVNPIEENIRGITPFTVHKHKRILTPINIKL